MLVPAPIEFSRFNRYFFTLTLVGLNLVVFFIFATSVVSTKLTSSELPSSNDSQNEMLKLSGQLYYQWLADNNKQITVLKNINDPESPYQQQALGWQSLRDKEFREEALKYPFIGDQVLIKHWLQYWQNSIHWQQHQGVFIHGLSAAQFSWLQIISYQFMHSTVWHLLGNMIFLFVIGMAVEHFIGGLGIILLYLLGGYAGALAFLGAQGSNDITPMVGASASVSALMSFYMIVEGRKYVRYFYFLSPLSGHYGFIYLSPFLIGILFILSDVGQWLSSPEELGASVAYSAHLGGALLGLVLGGLYRLSALSNKAFAVLNPSQQDPDN